MNGFCWKALKERLRRLGKRFSIQKKMRVCWVLATSGSLLWMIGLGLHDLKMTADRKLSSMHSAEHQAGMTSWLLAAARHRPLICLPWFHEVLNRLQFDHGWECAMRVEQLCLDYAQVYVGCCYRRQKKLPCAEGWE